LAACKKQPNSLPQPQPLNFDHTIYLNHQPIQVVVFDTPAEREKGLMWVKKISKDHGALFVFEQEENVGFWMKNTLISLDILFFNSQGKLIKAQSAVQPCQVKKCEVLEAEKVKFVLELTANSLASSSLILRVPY
jgi:uncharacterized membrane protein (UPF0127 family)